MQCSPFSFIENYFATPRGTTPAFLKFFRDLIVRGNVHPWSISLLMAIFSAAALSTDWDDLWFPVGKTMVGYKRGRPLPVLPRIRSRLPRGTQELPQGGVPSQ